MDKPYSYYTAVAVDASKEAVRLIQTAQYAPNRSAREKDDRTFVTAIDLASEKLIVNMLRAATPDFSIYAEEEAAEPRSRGAYTWIIDPIDGTHNFHYGFPCFAVQIALEHQHQVVAAVIALPAENIILHASRGGGCFANNERVRVSQRALKEGLLMLESRWSETDIKLMRTFNRAAHDIRVINSSCTSIAYVALGRADALIDWDDKPWDLAAGTLLVEEAGGRVTNLHGQKFDIYNPQCVASNGVEHDTIITLIRRSMAFNTPTPQTRSA